MNFKNFKILFLKNYFLEKEKHEYNTNKLKSNFNLSFFEFNTFLLKSLIEKIETIESYFQKNLIDLFTLEEAITQAEEKINSSASLLDAFIDSNNKEASLFYSSYDKRQDTLINNNLPLDFPVFVEALSLQIDEFSYDGAYWFKLHLELLEDNVFKKKSFFITPYKFSGEYIEFVDFKKQSVYESTFVCLDNYKIVFFDTNKNEISADYKIENNKIVLNKDNFLFEEIFISYTPIFTSNKVVLNCTILKAYLETNYDKDNKKKIIYVGSEDSYV